MAKRTAVINKTTNIVESVIMTLDPGDDHVMIDSPTANRGDIYNPATGTFAPPAAPTPLPDEADLNQVGDDNIDVLT